MCSAGAPGTEWLRPLNSEEQQRHDKARKDFLVERALQDKEVDAPQPEDLEELSEAYRYVATSQSGNPSRPHSFPSKSGAKLDLLELEVQCSSAAAQMCSQQGVLPILSCCECLLYCEGVHAAQVRSCLVALMGL